MKLSLDSVEIKLPWSLLALLLLCGVLGQTMPLWAFAALLPHEMGHFWAARRLGAKVASLELLPFGAVMRLLEPLDGMAELAVAAAGPAASIGAATLCAGLMRFFPAMDFLNPFISASLVLAVVNCLPALPLDGGRMLRALLGPYCPAVRANQICCMLGFGTAAALFAVFMYLLTFGRFHFSLGIMGVFLLAGAAKEWTQSAYAAAAASVRRQGVMRSAGSMRMQTVAVHHRTCLRVALKRLRGASIVAVMDDDMRLMGTLAEGDILAGMANGGSERPIGELLRRTRQTHE